MSFSDLDYEDFTIEITQNGESEKKTWSTKKDFELGTSAGSYKKGSGELVELYYGIYNAGDDFTKIQYAEINVDDPEVADYSMAAYTDRTLYVNFYIKEVHRSTIVFKVTGTRNGSEVTLERKIDVPGLSDSPGSPSLPARLFVGGYKYQYGRLDIYGTGYKGDVTITMTDDEGEEYFNENAETTNLAVFLYWNIPGDIPVGDYTVTLEGTSYDGEDYTVMAYPVHIEEGYPEDKCWREGDIEDDQDDPISPAMLAVIIAAGVLLVMIILVILLVFTYSRLKKKALLDQMVRKRIYEHIEKNQGVHFRGLMDSLDLKQGTLTHHLNILEQNEFVRSYQDGVYRRFYLFESKPPMSIKLSNIQERILEYIRNNPGIVQADISKAVGTSRMVVNYHIRLMRAADLVSVEKDGNNQRCFIFREPRGMIH
jgi:predicted transcriptional regulator